eukprot:403357477
MDRLRQKRLSADQASMVMSQQHNYLHNEDFSFHTKHTHKKTQQVGLNPNLASAIKSQETEQNNDGNSDINLTNLIKQQKRQEVQESLLLQQFDILDRIERMERIHPKAAQIFIDEAAKRGIYKPIPSDYKKSANSSVYNSTIQSFRNPNSPAQNPNLARQNFNNSIDQNNSMFTKRRLSAGEYSGKFQTQKKQSQLAKFVVVDLDGKNKQNQKFDFYMDKINAEESKDKTKPEQKIKQALPHNNRQNTFLNYQQTHIYNTSMDKDVLDTNQKIKQIIDRVSPKTDMQLGINYQISDLNSSTALNPNCVQNGEGTSRKSRIIFENDLSASQNQNLFGVTPTSTNNQKSKPRVKESAINKNLFQSNQSQQAVNFDLTQSKSSTKLFKNQQKRNANETTNYQGNKLPVLGEKTSKFNLQVNQLNPFQDKKKGNQESNQFLLGGQSPIAHIQTVYDDTTIITRRVQIVQKLQKQQFLQQSLLDINNKPFHDLFKKLCTTNYTSNNLQGLSSSNQGSTNNNQSSNNSTSPKPKLDQRQDKNVSSHQPNILIGSLNSQQTQNNPNILYVLKNLRLSKQNLKGYISKRYGKSISDRLMIILETYNKQMHNIELNSYIDLINHTFFSIQNSQNPQNSNNFQVPNIYKLLFQIIDVGNKGFICEHDLFQIIWALSNDKIQSSCNQQEGTESSQRYKNSSSQNIGSLNSGGNNEHNLSLSINYKDYHPQVKSSVYIQSFQSDFNIIIRDLERQHKFQKQHINDIKSPGTNLAIHTQATLSLVNNKKLQQTGNKNITSFGQISEDSDNHSSSSTVRKRIGVPIRGKIQNKSLSMPNSISPRQGVKKDIRMKKIFQAIYESAQTNMNDIETAPKTNTSYQYSNQSISPQISAFSHNNPVQQMIKERKEAQQNLKNQTLMNYTKQNQSEKKCKQMTFEQFVKLPFENEIPAFIEDLFQLLTTLSYREVIRKQTQSGMSNNSNFQKQVRRKNTSTNIQIIFSSVDGDDYQYTRRLQQYQKILKHYDKQLIKNLTGSFKLLSKNRQQEDDKLSLFLTQQSIIENFKKVFLISNESLSLRFYNVLSEGINMKRIYLPKYIATLLPLFVGNIIDKNYFIFRLLDGDNDGQIQSKDISDILSNVLVCPIENEIRVCQCPLFMEVHLLYEIYVKTNLLTYKVKKLEMDFNFFMNKIPVSCLIQEFIDKLSMSRQRPSIFSHEQYDQTQIKRQNKNDLEIANIELAALKKKGFLVECNNAKIKKQTIDSQVLDVIVSSMQNENEHNANEGDNNDENAFNNNE